ncbi:MAG: PD40 domain-containing protein [Acidobacteria bacterium]|nr:PD40 domain-containing protein [Acidobacteriota bacterium]
MDTPHPQTPQGPKTVPFPAERLDSWKEIARYLNRDIRTVQRWEETAGLPVYRKAQGRLKGSPVYAYRSELDAWLRQSPPPPVEKEAPPVLAVSAVRSRSRVLWVAGLVLILAAGGALVWRFARPKPAAPPLRVVRLTSYPGQARQPAFSPDGRQVGFSWNGEKQDNYDIYVRFLDGGAPLRLTTHPGLDGWPAWSPDGRTIAFWRWVRGTPDVDVLTVPALGGSERRIMQFRIPLQPGVNVPGLCWTPDGKWIVTVHTPNPNVPAALALASVDTLEIRPLTRPVAGTIGDCCPAITPDGRRLAFLRASTGRTPSVFVLPLGPGYRPEGEPRQLTREPNGATNPMWTGDGREMLYISGEGGARELWRVPQDSSRPASQVESLGPIGMGWTISARGDRLAYSDRGRDSDIWRFHLPGGTHLERVVSSSASDSNPEISPDGKRVAFLSNRRGGRQVWVVGSDGANPIDIARIRGEWSAPARWSPDGNQIVFECQNEGNDDICTVPAGGGAVRRLTRHQSRDAYPSWSRDGKWIYFTSNRSGSFQIWKAPADGTDAAAVQVTKGGGYSAVESSDGTTVFFVRDRAVAGVWKVPLQGGPESQVGAFRFLGTSHNYAVRPEGIYYASSAGPEQWFELRLYRFGTGESESICRIDKRFGDGLSVSPDGRWLWFAADEARYGDLYMVENFR